MSLDIDPTRVASAPYNFVPISEQVVWAPPYLPRQDRYDARRHTGSLDVTLTTLAPLFIRGPLPADDYALLKPVENDSKHPLNRKLQTRPDFYHHGDPKQPVIPSASLVGMLRNVVAAASAARLQGVSKTSIFFRNFAVTSRPTTRRTYFENLGEQNASKVRAGYLKAGKEPDAWWIEPAEEAGLTQWKDVFNEGSGNSGSAARIHASKVRVAQKNGRPQFFFKSFTGQGPNAPGKRSPKKKERYRPQWYVIDYQLQGSAPYSAIHNVRLASGKKAPSGWQRGALVFSGNMVETEKNDRRSRRSHVALVLERISGDPDKKPLHISPKAISAFERAYEDHDLYPSKKVKGKPRTFETGRPVFYVPEDGNVVHYFGFSPNFRIPYTSAEEISYEPATPASIRPPRHKKQKPVDFTEALFGFSPTEDNDEEESFKHITLTGTDRERLAGYRKRVSVEDAFLEPSEQEGVFFDRRPWVPRVLAEPKPSAYPLYLQQPDKTLEKGRAKDVLHYGSPGATPRGFKRYWHQGPEDGQRPEYDPKSAAWRNFVNDWRKLVEEPDPAIREKMLALHRTPMEDLDQLADVDTQHTLIRPLRPGLTFSFRIHFENLSDEELGALLWVIEPRQPKHKDGLLCLAHHLGMGKPLGMGSVRLDAKLTLTPRDTGRYEHLFDADGPRRWHIPKTVIGVPLSDPVAQEAIGVFTNYVEKKLSANGEPQKPFDGLNHVKALLRMMAWPGLRAEHLPLNENAPGKRLPKFDLADRVVDKRTKTRYLQIEVHHEELYENRKVKKRKLKNGKEVSIKRTNEYSTDPVLPPATHDLFEEVEVRSRACYKTVREGKKTTPPPTSS